jgi:hypothetical protein
MLISGPAISLIAASTPRTEERENSSEGPQVYEYNRRILIDPDDFEVSVNCLEI